MYSYLKCSIKWGTQNRKFKVRNQHKNETCHVQSLKKDFYLIALSSFNHVFSLLHFCSPQGGEDQKEQENNGFFSFIFVPHKADMTKRNKKKMVFSPLSCLFKDMAHPFFKKKSCFLSYFCNIICICFMFFSTTHNLLF